MAVDRTSATREAFGAISRLIDLIGGASFETEFVNLVHELCSVDHLHVFRLIEGQPKVLVSISHDGTPAAELHARVYHERNLWRTDPAMAEAARTPFGPPCLLRLETPMLSVGALRSYRTQMQLQSRTMITGRDPSGVLGVSLVWAAGSPGDLGDLGLCGALYALLSKHMSLCERPLTALQSVPQVEARLRSVLGAARPRELQVGARLLMGDCGNDIAADLGIGIETVVSHRKRLYERLELRNTRDFLLWYLSRPLG